MSLVEATSSADSLKQVKEKFRERFSTKFDEWFNSKKQPTIKTDEVYAQIWSAVEKRDEGERFTGDKTNYNYCQRFTLRKLDGKTDLMHKEKIVIKSSCLFEVLYIAHTTDCHCGRDLMMPRVSQYFGITQEIVTLFLHFYETCPLKKGKAKKSVVVKPIVSKEQNERCQLDLIDLQSKPDRDFKFVLVYQDHLTKFAILRPLRSKTANEVADQVKSIFAIFGAPTILHSDNGREFKNSTLEALVDEWNGQNFVRGKPRHSQSQGSVERCNKDIGNIMFCLMHDLQTTEWANLLNRAQYIKNTRYHSGIKQTPFKAMFGHDPPMMTTEESDEESNVKLIESPDSTLNADSLALPTIPEQDESLGINADHFESEEDFWKAKYPNPDNASESQLQSRSYAIETQRQEAHKAMTGQADRMLQTSNSRYGVIKVGTNVLVKIQEVDRPKIGPRNLLAVVLEERDGFYKIGTKNGQLPNWYSRNQLEPTSEQFIAESDVPENDLKSFRSAVAKDSITGGQGVVHCNCAGKCENKRCSCKKADVQCNSRCHKSNSSFLNK